MTDLPDGSGSRGREAVQATVVSFLATAGEQCRALVSDLSDLDRATDANEAMAALHRMVRTAHKLAGSAGSFGFPALGRRASALEFLLEGILGRDALPSPSVRAQVDLLARRLADRVAVLTVDQSSLVAGGALDGGAPSDARRRMLLIGPEADESLARLAERMEGYGWRVDWQANAAMGEDPARSGDAPAPGMILVDGDAGLDAIAASRRWVSGGGIWPDVPWYVAETRPSAGTRAAAVAAGCAGVFHKPLVAEALLDHHAAVLDATRDEGPRVMMHDPEQAIAGMVRHVLSEAGALVEVVEDPDLLIHGPDGANADDGVDVVVVAARGAETNSFDGASLAMTLRRDPAWAGAGLVLVAPPIDPGPMAETLARGGDVVVSAPFEPDLLVATVLGQATRARDCRRSARREGLGPLLVRDAMDEVLTRKIDRAVALDLPLVVAWLLPECSQALRPEADAVLARLLRETLPASDLAGRAPGEGVAVVLGVSTDAEAKSVLDQIAAGLARLCDGCGLVSGVATATPGDTAATLLQRARTGAGA